MQLTNESLRLLCRGANSEIYLYGQKAAKVILKVVPTSCTKQSKHLANEQTILQMLDHQGIIRPLKYKENIKLNGISRNVLVLEYANQGSLLDFLKKNKMEVPQIRGLFQQLCQTIQYLHCNYIVHRDLKLENILVTKENQQVKLKLSDFGFACRYYQDGNIKKFNSFKGTRRGYMAPQIHEVYTNPSKQYDARKADIFALGVILFALIFGKLPFEYANKQNKIFQQITNGNYEQFWKNHQTQLNRLQLQNHSMIEDLKDLLLGMINSNPQNRFSIQQILEHAWMQGIKDKIQLK